MTPLRDDKEPTARSISIPSWLLYLLIWIASQAITGYVGYASAQSSMNARVSVLESRWQDIGRRLDVIEQLLRERP